MTRLFANLLPVTLLAAISLAACAGAPPSEPTMFAAPSAGESLNQFQADDLDSRNGGQPHTASLGATQAAANRSAVGNAAVGTAVGASAGAPLAMSKGNTIVTPPPDYGYAYQGGYPYYYAYPDGYRYYGAYPNFIGTGPFFFGPRFHGHFHHGGFHHGGFGHGGFHHGGFHHGGFGHEGSGHFGHSSAR
jgi:hypothetical protein